MNKRQFYRSGEWRKFRELYISMRQQSDHILRCDRCGKPLLYKDDIILHHRHELTDDNVNDYSISLNPDNISMICFKCHNEVHDRFVGGMPKQHVYLVYGPPCSGKTSFVKRSAAHTDIILDLDTIWQSISTGQFDDSERYDHPDCLKRNVFIIRDKMIDMIKTRTGRWHNAYVIGGYPDANERKRMCDLLGADQIFIDTSKEECIRRAEEHRPAKWKMLIDEWFDDFTYGGESSR